MPPFLAPLIPVAGIVLALVANILGFALNAGWTILNLRLERRQSDKLEEIKEWMDGRLEVQRDAQRELVDRVRTLELQVGL